MADVTLREYAEMVSGAAIYREAVEKTITNIADLVNEDWWYRHHSKLNRKSRRWS